MGYLRSSQREQHQIMTASKSITSIRPRTDGKIKVVFNNVTSSAAGKFAQKNLGTSVMSNLVANPLMKETLQLQGMALWQISLEWITTCKLLEFYLLWFSLWSCLSSSSSAASANAARRRRKQRRRRTWRWTRTLSTNSTSLLARTMRALRGSTALTRLLIGTFTMNK